MAASAPLAAALDLTRHYTPPRGAYDELRDSQGVLRPHWARLFDQLGEMGQQELERRWDKARQLLHENGVSYNVYGDPQGVDRPWNLSPIPLLLPAEHWRTVEAGLSQRARLLEALLSDIYGPQRMLLEGQLPPELVFANAGFLRPAHGMRVAGDRWLPLYSADLVRTHSGEVCVLEDRTQAPSGAGYALENRIVISHVLPEAFRECGVERLALFFRTLRDSLQRLAPHNRDNPRIVLLTAGPYNATYFEQAYLAQYLGYTLVNGGDLTVRRDRVFLKTLGGLHPVDVILRRVNDDFCDPLELRPDSLLGVPGLMQAARAGHVAIANPLGSGVLQTAALAPYLPQLSRALLGEELMLPSVRSYWCGDPAARAEGLHLLDDALVRPAFSFGYIQPTLTMHLTETERATLREQILARPSEYVVQERVEASVAPTLSDRTITSRAMVLRCFAVAGRGEHVVMPGGLARVAGAGDGTEFSMQMGAHAKDTWVLADGPVNTFSLLPPVHRPVVLSRGGSDLPSRAADDLYWLGRYAERAEGVARSARVVSARLGELSPDAELDATAEFVPLVHALSAQVALSYTAPLRLREGIALGEAQRELAAAVLNLNLAGSLRSSLRSTLRTGRLVRDRISTDAWRVLAGVEDELQGTEHVLTHDPFGVLNEVLNRIVLRLAAFSGLVVDSMTRGHAWRFLDMGRRLERSMTLVSLLRATLTETCAQEGPLLEGILDIADSGMTYRRRYLANLQTTAVVDMLLVDETNPRSVVYQIGALTEHLAALPAATHGIRSHEERTALGLLTDLRLLDVEQICAQDDDDNRTRLRELLVDLATRIPALSDALAARYLNHATVSRHLGADEATQSALLSRGEEP